ncbi:MAG: hypothetical protein OEV60_00010 [Actinomycetota bacterium]|nr:hypothetical protein [Actinomycetota bacterium]MDH5224034.1 hypothetical protein [Actinomycetota bacterium]MDH5312321.1 hypothetical protein [Actinomycetota bacterium]
MRHSTPILAALALAALAPACTVSSHPTAGVRANRRGNAVILAPTCTDSLIVAVQVADLDGAVRWRVEGGGNEYPTTFVVGREPPLLVETHALEEPLRPGDAYVATVEYAGSLPEVDVEFRPSSLRSDRVIDAGGDSVTMQRFADDADLGCVGDWLWIFGSVAVVFVVGVIASFFGGLWIVVRVVRKAKRERESNAAPTRPDLSGR